MTDKEAIEMAIRTLVHIKDSSNTPHIIAACSIAISALQEREERHGRWVSVQHKLARVCSVCNRDEPYKFADVDADVYNYCPNCGAKMDKEETNELDKREG